MSVSDLNEDNDVSVTRDRLGLSSHVNGMATSTVPKNFPHSVLVTSTGQPLFLRQPLMQGDRASMVPIASPFLTQASVFYSPHFLGPQQLAAAHQFTQVSPLIPLRSNVSLTRENCASAAAHNGCIVNKASVFKTDDEPSSCSKSGCAAPGLMYDSSVVINEAQDGRDLAAVGATSAATSPSGSSGTPKSPLTPGTPQPTVPSPVVDEICVICSDKATGHHYGVTSCEGCKGFFKRSVQNRKTYSCRNLTQDCPVDKRHRNRCQFCRFQKCVKAGMLKEAVREDRTPGGKHKNRPLSLQSRTKPEPAKQARTHSSSSSSLGSEGDLQQSTTHSTMPSRTFPPFITELLRHEPCDSEYLDECPSCQLEDTGQKTLAHVTQLAEVQVRKNQEWFKSLPLLVNINDSDKKILIRSAWLELMLINLTKHSLHFDNKVHLCKGQVLDVSTALATGIGDILNRVMQLTAKFKELNLDGAEFVCIKVIVLLNPDVKGLYEQPLIERLQDKVHASLLEYNNAFHPSEPNRFGNILLRLPELRSIGTKCLERLFMLSFTGQIHTSNSLSELLHSTRR